MKKDESLTIRNNGGRFVTMAGDLPLSCEPIWNSRQQRDCLETSNSKKKN